MRDDTRPIRDLLPVDLEACLAPNPQRPRWVWWGLVLMKSYGLPRVRVLLCYRFAQLMLRLHLPPVAWLLTRHALKVGGAEIHPEADIGPGLDLWHTVGIVIGGNVVVGKNFTVLQGVTIGAASRGGSAMATIGDNVFVGAGAIILGPVKIGDHATVGAGSTVTHDVPDHGVVKGQAAR